MKHLVVFDYKEKKLHIFHIYEYEEDQISEILHRNHIDMSNCEWMLTEELIIVSHTAS